MKQFRRGILIFDLSDETAGEAAAILNEQGALADRADQVAAALNLLQTGDRPGLVLCALSDDVTGLVSAMAHENLDISGEADVVPVEAGAETPAPASDYLAVPLQPSQEASRTMVIQDPAMAAVIAHVEHVAPSDATVLITGESGTGKELIAAHLHRKSSRQVGPFVVIHCAGIADEQLESELFGHEKGAFYGAASRRVGKFEAADGGTLLLDEIGEMGLRMQAKVLRALQVREIDRVGGDKPVKVNVRIVATTNRDLQKEVRLGRFRADLLLQLNVVTLKVPPLRERPADVSALAAFFARKFAQANGRTNSEVLPGVLVKLQEHDWPGNVRELENVMHRAVLMETGPAITVSALAIDTADEAGDDGTAEALGATIPQAIARAEARGILTTAGRTIEAVEKEMILDTLCQCKGNRSQAATVLGISVRTLRNKLHEYERAGTRIPRPVIVAVS